MSNISLGQYLKDSPKLNNTEPVNEFLATAIAGSMLAFAIKPLLETDFFKTMGAGIGGMFAGIGSLFGFLAKKNDKDSKEDKGGKNDGGSSKTTTTTTTTKEDPKDEPEMSTEDKQKAATVLNAQMLRQDLEKKKQALKNANTDEEKKKAQEELDKAQSAHDIFLASAFNDKGEPESPDKIKQNLKANGLSDEDIEKLEKEAKKISAEDFEKNVKENCSDILDKDGKLDEKKLENLKGRIASDVEAAKKSIKKDEPENKPEDKKDDSKDEPEKDEDGNVVKDEEIEVKDPKTGEKKKMKVKTYTGPQGGKFYYPDGKPKTPENKVYVQESLSEWLERRLG